LYGFHRAYPEIFLKVQPFLDDQAHGFFATRYPCRSNPLELSVVLVIFDGAIESVLLVFPG
jgi:tRNA (adenine37-N6)-methyltransferase